MKLIVRAIQVLVPVVFLLLAIFGSIRFPYAPIKKTNSGYFDKRGFERTAVEYEKFAAWERVLTSAGVALAVTAVASAAHHYHKHKTLRIYQKTNQPIQDSAPRA